MGSILVRRRLMASTLSGSGIPADALGNLGDRYFDTTAQMWYLKRWVGNFRGIDRVEGMALASSGTTAPLRFDVVASRNGAANNLIGNGTTSAGARLVVSQTNIVAANDAIVASGVNTVPNGIFAKFSLIVDGTILSAQINGVQAGGTASGNANLYGLGWMRSGDRSGSEGQDFKLASAKAVRLDTMQTLLDWRYDDGSGITIRDYSPQANNGTLTDSTPTGFWLATWVPMNLL